MPDELPEGNYFLASPEGKTLHYPRTDFPMKPICGLHSGQGWEAIADHWEHLMPLCQRCQSHNGEV
jgi:hypothetical protein